MIPPYLIDQAIREKVSAVCAQCVLFWRARAKGLSSCGQDCGGPISGRDFPQYQGSITVFDSFCFVCRDDSVCCVKIPESSRQFGVCKRHLRFLDALRPVDDTLLISPCEVRSAKGLILPVQGRYSPKALVEVLADLDKVTDHGAG